jgi:prepilin-type N-terminal cleavage/methylation domain-containing protein
MSSMIIKMQSRRGTQGFTLVEVMVSMAVIAIVSVMVVSAFTTAANLKNKDTESRYDAAGTENLIATETEPNESLGVDLVVGDYAIEGGINSYTDGSRTYTLFDEGDGAIARPMVVDADFDDEGNARTTSGAAGEYHVTKTGKYKLEVWGAQGGAGEYGSVPSTTKVAGANGGYSKGVVALKKGDILYLKAGGAGVSVYSKTPVAGSFNGGGALFAEPDGQTGSSAYYNGSGGGASDIRINSDTLYSRVIVAGGGGGVGSGGSSTYARPGGVGGGLSGGTVTINDNYPGRVSGTGGTQVSGGATGTYYSTPPAPILAGFGSGGSNAVHNSNSYTGSSGGGGWYGGGGGVSGCMGGGGSGWIYTASAFSTWQAGNLSDASSYLLTSEYYLTEAQTIAGNAAMPDPYSWDSTTKTYLSNITGKTGGGFVRITWAGRA